MTAVSTVVASCATPTSEVATATTPPKAAAATATPVPQKAAATATPIISKYREAPQLAELVEQGTLPPVDERLAEEFLPLEPVHKIGKYGGDFVQGGLSPSSDLRVLKYEPLARWNIPWTEVIPGLAKEWEAQDESRTWVFYLRKGIKWSDGEPVTADDVLFYFEELSNTDLYPNYPKKYTTKSGPGTISKLDDYTVEFSFAEPFGLFALLMAARFDGNVYSPSHYNKQFFPGYADKAALDAKIKEEGVTNWYEGYATWVNPMVNSEVPVIWAWDLTSTPPGSPQVVFERNPYYWKADTEGNQLPYCDRFVIRVAGDREAIIMMAVAGEISYQYHHISELKNKPMYLKNADKGDFHIVDCTYPGMGDCILHFNLNHKESAKRQLFQDKQFRIGISHALNRQEMVDIANQGVGFPWQPSPLPESTFYDEEMAMQYIKYDLEKANASLDEVIADKDSEGFRLGPDGESLGIVCIINSDRQSHIDSCELIKQYMADVGIRWENKVQDRALSGEMMAANEHDVWPFYGDAGLDFDILLQPKNYFAMNTWYAPLWAQWYNSGGSEGEEPPEAMQMQMALYDELTSSGDPEFQHETMEEILRIAKEEYWTVGTWRGGKFCAICKNSFKNVPDAHWVTWPYPDPGPFNPCTFFWDT
jgi:peptide/nickel transport system substrate-binding protein